MPQARELLIECLKLWVVSHLQPETSVLVSAGQTVPCKHFALELSQRYSTRRSFSCALCSLDIHLPLRDVSFQSRSIAVSVTEASDFIPAHDRSVIPRRPVADGS